MTLPRTAARGQALEVLYEADSRNEPLAAPLGRLADREGDTDPYAAELVTGVAAHREEIDELIASHAIGWDLGHMPVVDRNALRLGLYELLWTDVPPAVAMDEAVELCRLFSTEEAGRFVNGVMAAIAAERTERTTS